MAMVSRAQSRTCLIPRQAFSTGEGIEDLQELGLSGSGTWVGMGPVTYHLSVVREATPISGLQFPHWLFGWQGGWLWIRESGWPTSTCDIWGRGRQSLLQFSQG